MKILRVGPEDRIATKQECADCGSLLEVHLSDLKQESEGRFSFVCAHCKTVQILVSVPNILDEYYFERGMTRLKHDFMVYQNAIAKQLA